VDNERNSSATDPGHGGVQVLIDAGPARFVGDLGAEYGGLDLGPSPHQIAAAALAACTAQTLRLYVRRKGWAVGEVVAEVAYRSDPKAQPSDIFTRNLTIAGQLDDEQRARMLEIAEKCPIHRLLSPGATIVTHLLG
jgi:putative redox protein